MFSIRSRSSRSTRRTRGRSLLYSLDHRRGLFFGVGYIPLETREHSLLLFSKTVTLPRLMGSEARTLPPLFRRSSFVRYFSSGTLARQSYSPALRSRPPVPPFPSIWPGYTGTPSRPSFSASDIPYSFHVTPDWKVCSVENSVGDRDIRRRAVLYIAGQLTLQDRAMSGIPVERSLCFIGPILETFYVVRRILSSLYIAKEREKKKKENIFSISSLYFSIWL